MTRSKPAPKGPHLPTPAELDALFATPQAFERWLAKQRPECTFQYHPLLYFVQDVFHWGPVLETVYEQPFSYRSNLVEYPIASYSAFINQVLYRPSEQGEYVRSSELPDWVVAFAYEYQKVVDAIRTSVVRVRQAYAAAKGAD